MSETLRRAAAFLTAIAVFAVDRWTKHIVETSVGQWDSKPLVAGMLNVVRSANRGIAFGMFDENSSPSRTPILIGLSLVAILILGAMLWKIEKQDGATTTGIALIFGGAAGNVYDRVMAGSVTDFLDFYIGGWHWYTFNLADAAICTGAGLLILSMFRAGAHKREELKA